jgi:cellulose synthase/poly-beta-1,6-N-acetylglucosamine synthase-like glycosyltransferase
MRGDRTGHVLHGRTPCDDRAVVASGTGEPAVSVVIPTHRRPRLLQALLTGLAGQVLEETFEVIVVDDASGDDTRAVLERATTQVPFELTAIFLDRNGGPARARNLGWRRARAPLVAFTDDDCVPRPDWLARLLAASQEFDIVQGSTTVDPTELAAAGPFSRWINVGPSPFYETCNIAYPKSWLRELGGFDESFSFAAGEDTDLALRARHRGATIGPVPEAVVVHTVHPSSFKAGLRSSRRLDGLVKVVQRYPDDLRGYLHGPFWFPAHGPALLAAGGLVTAALTARRRRRWPIASVLLALPYLRHRLLVEPLTRRSRVERVVTIPAGLVVDLAEVMVVSRARLRYRGTAVRDAG